MRYQNIIGLCSIAALSLSLSSAHAQVTVGLDFVDTANPGAVSSVGTGTATFSTSASGNLVIGTVFSGAQSLGAFTLTDGGFSGTYHFSVDVTSTGTGDTDVGRGGSGTLSPGGNLMTAGEALTFSNVQLSFVSGDDMFKFDGFTGIRIGNLSGSEQVQANELLIADGNPGEGSGSSFTPTAALALSNTIVAESLSGGMSVNVVDAQFSVIPEPSSAALLLGLAGMFMVVRRRK